ncbi:MAG: hypothetical protein ABF990_12020 [Acetobacter sp.]|uniref:hypothetical protein n=1 Tax=Acetobacter sp. TaxID=440 RepID=UPI0039EAC141
MSEEADLIAFRKHMDFCCHLVTAYMRPDAKVTIIVRAPEALPEEAMITTNDNLQVVSDAISCFLKQQSLKSGAV